MVALAPEQDVIEKVRSAMETFMNDQEYQAVLIPSTIDSKGARIVDRASSL
jgi:hypothetical protein